MLLWISLAVFVIPLVYILNFGRRDRRARERELARIEERLAAKQRDAGGGADNE
ncbi:MAG: hypothetical protein AAGJ86_13705 [Pseudomonadota bacterium]